jgi:hypothetical protein
LGKPAKQKIRPKQQADVIEYENEKLSLLGEDLSHPIPQARLGTGNHLRLLDDPPTVLQIETHVGTIVFVNRVTHA